MPITLSILMKKIRTNPLTLIELMLVLVIIALALGAGAFSIPKAFHHRKFSKNETLLLAKIKNAYEVMLACDADLSLRLELKENKLQCIFENIWNVPNQVLMRMNQHPILEEICSLEWNHSPLQEHKLYFLNSKKTCSRGTLKIKGRKGDEKILYLRNQPSNITKYVQEVDPKTQQAPYPQEARSLT